MTEGPPTWHVLVGEYPPRPGGVGDYTALLAAGLAAAGATVHVWTTPAEGATPESPGVTVHRDVRDWSAADLARLDSSLDAFPAPRQLLVQYTPNSWGHRGLNLRFCRWLVDRRRRGDRVRVMFHEVGHPFELGSNPAFWVLAAGQRLMARRVVQASHRIDVSIPAWGDMVRSCSLGLQRPVEWRPVPSNIPVIEDAEAVASVRHRVAPAGATLLGSFSGFAGRTGPILAGALPDMLRKGGDRVALLIGHGSDAMKDRLSASHPDLAGRLTATGPLGPADVSRHLQACDLIVQGYPDGVTSRRGSVMAALTHGLPVVTNAGHLTEPVWAETRAVSLAPTIDPAGLVVAAERLLSDASERRRVAEAGRALYDQRFSLERTVEALLGAGVGAAT